MTNDMSVIDVEALRIVGLLQNEGDLRLRKPRRVNGILLVPTVGS